jgi:hypothetical protein
MYRMFMWPKLWSGLIYYVFSCVIILWVISCFVLVYNSKIVRELQALDFFFESCVNNTRQLHTAPYFLRYYEYGLMAIACYICYIKER